MGRQKERSRWKSWLLATRPRSLTTALVPILVGTALAYAIHQKVQLLLSALALASSLFIQVGTNLINDAMDFKKGADTDERLGPKRLIQNGILSPKWVFLSGLICFGIALLLGVPLVLSGGWPIIFIGIFSLLAGYSYTGGPYPLAYLGLGDLFVVIFYGWVAVGGMYYLHTGEFDLPVWVAGFQVGFLATVLIAINNLRDCSTDRKANKRTLVVRWGISWARAEIAGLCLAPFSASFFWYGLGLKWASLLPLAMLPLALILVQKIRTTEPSSLYNQIFAQGALLHLGFGALLTFGLVLG